MPGSGCGLSTNAVARYVRIQAPATAGAVAALDEVMVTGTQP